MKETKSILLSEHFADLERVYSSKVLEKLEETAGLDRTFYNKASVLQDPEAFKSTEYIFSTWGMPSLEEKEIAGYFPNLKCVFYAAGSVQYFAEPFLKSGIKVFSAWAANAVPVADYTAAQIVLALKGFFASSRLNKISRKEARARFAEYPGVFDETVGIIGAGMIGKMVIQRLNDLHLKCLVFDPFLPEERAKELNVTKCSLEELFGKSFVVSNHLANNEQTRGMLDYKLFSLMRRNAAFINTGRGAQVVEADLVKLLEERPDITAILDVTDPEPPVEGHAFYKLENCILTPHIAGSSGNEVHRMAEYMAEEYRKYLSGEPTSYEVSLAMLKTMA